MSKTNKVDEKKNNKESQPTVENVIDWQALETSYDEVDPKTLIPRKVNARHMPGEQFRRLVENVKVDGRLTSAVLVARNDDGSLEILSGHHRTMAAIEAGLETVPVIIIETPLDEDRRTAIQLSHNAITGQDDVHTLQKMYDSLGLSAKLFSGLLDTDFMSVSDVEVTNINPSTIEMETVSLMFLKEDAEDVDRLIKELEKLCKRGKVFVASMDDFDRFIEAVGLTKYCEGIVNLGLVFRVMLETTINVMRQRIEEDEREED